MIAVCDKFSGEVVENLPSAVPSDVVRAVDLAVDAISSRPLSPWDRYQILNGAAQLLAKESEELARLLVAEVGKTIRESRAEVANALQALVVAGEEAKRIHGDVLEAEAVPQGAGKFAMTIRVPSGPVCAIAAFNAPFNQAAQKIGSSIAAGCPVVFKPSPLTPLTTLRLADVLQTAGLPPGYLSVLLGDETLGNALLTESRFRRYMFTGSRRVGELIRATVGLRPSLLEMGSNSATIVHSDADLQRAAQACVASGYATAGQVCISVQRLLVQRSVLAEFTARVVAGAEALRVGDPRDESTDMGPMVSESAAARVESWITTAEAAGAKVCTGGGRNGGLVQPTVLTSVTNSMSVVCDEVFGPVICIMPYDDFDDAIQMANDTPYGLQAGLFTSRIDLAFRAIHALEVGGLMINDASRYRAPHLPFGGVKNSGVGREGPRYAIEELTDLKTVVFTLDGSAR